MAYLSISATAGRGCTALGGVTARRQPSRALAGAAVVAALNSACGERPLEPRPPDPGAPHFTVMSFNIELGAKREPSTLRSIGELDADLVGLQEVTPEAEAWLRDAYADQYPYQLYQSKGGAGGLAALSRFPLVDHGLRPAPEDWHPAWHFEAETPAGPVQLLDVHLRSLFSGDPNPVRSYLSTGSDHRTEMALFSDWCEQSIPTIVLGDFNESPDGPAIHYLEGRGFFNLLPAFRPGQPTWRFRSTGDQFSETFDHILINAELVPLNAWVQRRGESDHLPVLAHLEPRSW
jgi:endonuclease/exonuclease/phosphatase family metal-dependent hydrolase